MIKNESKFFRLANSLEKPLVFKNYAQATEKAQTIAKELDKDPEDIINEIVLKKQKRYSESGKKKKAQQSKTSESSVNNDEDIEWSDCELELSILVDQANKEMAQTKPQKAPELTPEEPKSKAEQNLATNDNHSEPASSSSSSCKIPDIEPLGNNKPPTLITNKSIGLTQEEFPAINENVMKECEECHQDFLRSFLYRNFAVHVCDECRDPKQAHELITRTDAKTKYLLKDCDLDLRKPPLRYMLKKNPYQSRGDMRLYLKYQIEERALEVHGSEEQLEGELEKREELRAIKKQKVHDKKMKSLSMQVRSSLYKRDLESHQHEFGEATCIDEDKDLYRRECKTCGYEWDYEEM